MEINKRDWLTIAVLSIIFFSLATWNLGMMQTPVTTAQFSPSQSFIIDLGSANGVKSVGLLIKDGYFEKLKFMGYTYKFYDDRIRFSDLRTGKDKTGGYESYIEYKIQDGTPEYKKAQEDWNKIRAELPKGKVGDDDAMAEYYTARKKVLPPAELKIIMGLEGGKIVPVKIQIGKEDAYLF